MKKKKLLSSALVVGALTGVLTMVTTSPASASDSTGVTVNLTGSGDGSSWTYSNGYADTGMDHKLNLGANGSIPTETVYDEDVYWDKGTKGSTNAVNMTGGQLSITGFDNSDNNHTTGKITATGGKIILNDNYLTIGSDSSISDNVVLQTAGSSTLRLTGGNVTVNDGDTISGAINATAGNLTIGGTRTLGNNYTVSGSAKTIIDGAITSNVSLAGTGGIEVNSGKSLTIDADNVDAAVTNNASNGLKLTGGILEKNVGGTGSTQIATTGTVTNTAAISQAVNVTNGTFNNTTGSVSGTTTISSGATAKQSGTGSLGAVSNAGKLEISAGTVTSITNTGTGTQGVSQSGGSVGTLTNAGTYTLSGGSITTAATNNGTFNYTGGSVNGTYNQDSLTTAKTNIYNGKSLTLTGTSTITKGSVNLGEGTNDTAGGLIFNNASANEAKISTAGTGANVLTVKGANTTLTLTDGSNIQNGTVTVGDAADKTANVLTMSGDTDGSVIGSAVTMNICENARVDMSGTASKLTINSGDTWNGQINQTNGTLTVLNTAADYTKTTGYLTSAGGEVVIGNNTTTGTLLLNNDNDTIASATKVNIGSGSTLKIVNSNATGVTLNNISATPAVTDDDVWNGNVELNSGALTLNNVAKTTTPATTGPDVPASTYVQTSGLLTMIDSSLTLNETGSKVTDGKILMNSSVPGTDTPSAGSQLVFNNGTDAANANSALIISDANTNNSITVGGTNGAELALKNGATPATDSNINKNTAITVSDANSTLIAYGDSIKGGTGSKVITNNGTFKLFENVADPTNPVSGTLARVLNGTGSVNLMGNTLSTSADTAAGTIDATIFQNNVTVGDGTGAADSSVFTVGANVTANTLLTVNSDGKIQNGTGTSIVAQAIDVKAGGKIKGIEDTSTTPSTITYGNLTVNNGGSNAGIIEQNNVTLNVVAAATPEKFDNTGTLTVNGTFTNNIEITDSAATKASKMNINGGGTSNAAITQNEVTVKGNTAFNNKANLTATKSLTNSGTINNTSNIKVQDEVSTSATYKQANLKNTGIINNTATTVGTTTTPATITADTLTNHDGATNGTINLTNSKLAVVYQADDIKGVINTLGNSASTDVSELNLANITTGIAPNFAGTLNVGKVADTSVKSGLNLKSGNIVENAIVNIATGNVMNVNGADSSLILDDGSVSGTADVFAGDLNLTSGSVEMKNLTLTTGDVSTTAATYAGTNPYYSQNGGALTLTNTTLSMADSSLISNPANTTALAVDAKSTFNSLSNAFSVQNLTTAGLINAINGGYENYKVATTFDVGEDSAANQRNQADFNIDIYARCDLNNNYKYDSFGTDDNTLISAVYDSDGDGKKDAILNLSDWQLNGDIYGWDAPIDRSYSLDKVFKGTVNATDVINFTATEKEVLTPIGWYGLHSAGGGNYTFDLNRFNPQVFRGQVTKIAQYQNQLAVNDMLFSHTMLDQGFKGNDYIASNPNRLASAGDLFPPYQYSRKDGGLWVKMYGTFEKLQMNQGFNVENNAYGTIIGADFGLKDLKNGWQFMPTAYIAYNGAHQNWGGTGAYQNGGQAGLMGTWYKNNFIIGALAYGGVYNNDMDTPRGNDDTLGYFAGGAVKSAYNWRFAKDWSLQPNLLVSYNFFGQENWHTDFGQMGMMSGMLHGINIAPGVNLIWEKETFSIYGTLQYMYNINQSVGGRAGHVDLPNVHMDRGYIQYGLGFNKRFSDRFSGFLQAVIRNVGRSGIGLQAGFQWRFGKDGSGEIKGYTPELKKTDIQLNNNKV